MVYIEGYPYLYIHNSICGSSTSL